MSEQQISSARINITLANVRSWRSALINDNPFNPRLYYHKQPWQLDLRDTNTYSYQTMLRGEQTRVLGGLFANVINRDDIRQIRSSMADLQARSLDTIEEYGTSWVVLMTGMTDILTHRGRAIAAPLFIRRIAIASEGMPARDHLITCVGDWDVNRDLLYVLHRDWKLDVDARVLVDTFVQQGWDRAVTYFQQCLGKLVGVRITHERFIGVLPDSYLAAAIDIDRKIALYPRHDLVAAVSGSEEAQMAVRRKVRVSIPANLPDRLDAGDDLLILDADSSQQQAINTAISGASFVVQGPPGTGKSQTVANMAAALASRGQRVLVTSAKGTSRQDIVRRLEDAGCGMIVADLSSHENITPVINHMVETLQLIQGMGDQRDANHDPDDPANDPAGRDTDEDFATALQTDPVEAIAELCFMPEDDGLATGSDGADADASHAAHDGTTEHTTVGTTTSGATTDTTAAGTTADDTTGTTAGAYLQITTDGVPVEGHPFATEQVTSDTSTVATTTNLTEAATKAAADDRTISAAIPDLDLHLQLPPTSPETAKAQALLAEDEPNTPRDRIGADHANSKATIASPGVIHVPAVSVEPWTSLRQEFLSWVDTVHHLWQPWNVSYASAQTALRTLQDVEMLPIGNESAAQHDAQQHHQIRALLRTWSEMNKQIMVSPIEWNINKILTRDQAKDIEACLRDLHERLIPQARKDRFALFEANVITRTPTIEDWSELLTLLFELEDFKELFGEDIIAQDFDLWIARLNRGFTGFFGGFFNRWNSKYRALKRDVLARYGGQERSFKAIVAELEQGIDLKRRWLEKAQSLHPVVPGDKYDVAEVFDAIVAGLNVLDACTSNWNPWILTHDQLQTDITILTNNVAALQDIPNLHDIGDKLRQVRVYPMIDAVRTGKINGDNLADVFTKTWLTAVLDHIVEQSPLLQTFEIGKQREDLSLWRRTDVAHINEMANFIVKGVMQRLQEQLYFGKTRTEAMHVQPPTKPLNVVQAHRHMQQMLNDAPNVLGALHPIWVASPKQVAEIFPSGEFFDVVIIDEASVMSVEHAVAPLSRAKRVIAVGDRHQLPPKHPMWLTMPAGSSHEAKRPESLFRILRSFLPEVSLTWGHRARDGRIHRVTNPNIYANELTVFPSTTTKVPVSIVSGLHHDEIYEHVVAQIIAHTTHYPEQSIGVITVNDEQANALRTHFEYKMGRSEGLATAQLLAREAHERLFIKPVDLTQGEERDAIIVVVPEDEEVGGFPDLEGPNGFYRLNVALTRARHRVTLLTTTTVAKFAEIQQAYETAKEENKLERSRDTLADRPCITGGSLAQERQCPVEGPGHNGLALFAAVLSADYEYRDSEPDHDYRPIINEICTALRRRLIPVSVAVGTGPGAIDIAVAHPDNPGQMVLAIELDTTRYAHRHTVRDRERLITKALQARGWRVYRLWLHHWFTDEQAVVEEIETAWRQAVKIVDEQEAVVKAKRAVYDHMVRELAQAHQEEVRKQAREREHARRESLAKEKERVEAQVAEEEYQSEQKRELARIEAERRKEIATQIQAERKTREATVEQASPSDTTQGDTDPQAEPAGNGVELAEGRTSEAAREPGMPVRDAEAPDGAGEGVALSRDADEPTATDIAHETTAPPSADETTASSEATAPKRYPNPFAETPATAPTAVEATPPAHGIIPVAEGVPIDDIPPIIVVEGLAIDRYPKGELVGLARWVIARTPEFSDDEVIDTIMEIMGFTRRGKRIVRVLQSKVEQARNELS